MNTHKKLYIHRTSIPFLLIYAAIVLMCLYVLRYIVPSADDYANSLDVAHYMTEMGVGNLRGTWHMVYTGYMNNQGTWFSSILDFLPLSFGSLYSYWALRGFMLVADLLLFYALASLVYHFAKRYLVVDWFGLTLLAIAFCGLNHASPQETLYWMNGACVYTIPFGCALLSMALFISFLDTRKKGRFVASAILGFLSTGGSLVIAGFLCAATLSILICETIADKKFSRSIPVYLGINIIGALINTLAPGNFTRHTKYVADGSLSFADGFINSFVIIHDRFKLLATEGFLWALIISVIIIYLIMVSIPADSDMPRLRVNPILVAICGYGCIYATVFPMTLGYGMNPGTYYMDFRLSFTIGFVILITTAFVLGYTSLWLRLHIKFLALMPTQIGRTIVGLALVGSLFLGTFISLYDPYESNMYLLVMTRELRSGKMDEVYAAQRAAIERIKNTEGYDAIIDFYIPHSLILKDQGLTYDNTWWVNHVMGIFYGDPVTGRKNVYYWPPDAE